MTLAYELETLRESMGQLELALEDVGWQRLTWWGEQEFSRDGLDRLVEICRLMALKNPLIKQGVAVICNYVFGQGVTISAKHPLVNDVIQAFVDDEKNVAELTSHQAMLSKHKTLLTAGNLFFVLFTNELTGRVRVRSLRLTEVRAVITNPDDAKEPWYYERRWPNVQGGIDQAYYPDWQYQPLVRPATYNNHPIKWESPIYHVKTGGFDDMVFGIPDVYAAVDWAKAYKEFLEDWATITRALSRFAWKASTKGGKKSVASIKNKLGTTYAAGGMGETNPPPTTGSTVVLGEGNDFEPIKTAGATTSMEDGRRLLLMVASALGLPETFFGDVSVGTLATATSLDRPTALLMANQQEIWKSIFNNILRYVLQRAVAARQGSLRSLGRADIRNDDGQEAITLIWQTDTETGNPIEPGVVVDFPDIVQADQKVQIDAITTAATHLPDGKLIARLLLTALGVPHIDEVLDAMFVDGQPAQPVPVTAPTADTRQGTGDQGHAPAT